MIRASLLVSDMLTYLFLGTIAPVNIGGIHNLLGSLMVRFP